MKTDVSFIKRKAGKRIFDQAGEKKAMELGRVLGLCGGEIVNLNWDDLPVKTIFLEK